MSEHSLTSELHTHTHTHTRARAHTHTHTQTHTQTHARTHARTHTHTHTQTHTHTHTHTHTRPSGGVRHCAWTGSSVLDADSLLRPQSAAGSPRSESLHCLLPALPEYVSICQHTRTNEERAAQYYVKRFSQCNGACFSSGACRATASASAPTKSARLSITYRGLVSVMMHALVQAPEERRHPHPHQRGARG